MRRLMSICLLAVLAGMFFFGTAQANQRGSLIMLDNDLYSTGNATNGEDLAREVPDYIGVITSDDSVHVIGSRDLLPQATIGDLDNVSKEVGTLPHIRTVSI